MLPALCSAEARKLVVSWMVPGILIGALAAVLVGAGALVLVDGTEAAAQSGVSLADPAQVSALLTSASSGSVFLVAAGIVMITAEYRHGTITALFLGEPRRWIAVTAKVIVAFGLGVVAAVALSAVVWAFALPALAIKGYDNRLADAETWRAIGGLVVALGWWCAIGVVVGAIIRSQVGALVGALVWFFLPEALLVAFLPDLGKWLPTGAAQALVSAAPNDLLPWWGGALLMLGYLAVGYACALVMVRRDVG